MKKFLYIDESGDLGFDFARKNPSSFFTITLLIVNGEEENKKMKKQVELTLKRKLNPKAKRKRIIPELKGTNTTLTIRKYFYERVKDIDFEIYSLTINKKKVTKELQRNKQRLYNYVVRLLLDRVPFNNKLSQLLIFLDKSKNKKQIQDCNRYLVGNIEGRIPLTSQVDIYHEDSQKIRQLQAVDIFCYGIARKYNMKDSSWFDVFSKKVRCEKLFFK